MREKGIMLNRVKKMKNQQKKTPAKKVVIAKNTATTLNSAGAINSGANPASAKEIPTDLNDAMENWAKKHAITEQQRDELSLCILNYEATYPGTGNWRSLREDEFSSSICDDVINKMFSLKQRPSAEKIKDEIQALQTVLERLSFEARDCIDNFIPSNKSEIPRDFHYVRLLTLQACERASRTKEKEGRRRPSGRIKLIKSLYSSYERVTGMQPTSSPKGCFCDFAEIALEKYGMTLESLSRDVQKIKQFKSDMEFIGIADGDPDFIFSS
jgi:hypothetical protein